MKNSKKLKDLNNPVNSEKSRILSLNLRENNVLTKSISIIFLILIMSGLFAFIIFGLYKFKLIEIPAFIENIFFRKDDAAIEFKKDDAYIYDFLSDITDNANNIKNTDNPSSAGSYNSGEYVLDITLDNIKDIISTIKIPDNLYLETEAKYYIDRKLLTKSEMSLWKKGNKYKYTLTVNSKLEETYINNSINEYVVNHRTGSKLIQPANKLFSFDNIPHMPDINYYLNLLESAQIVNYYLDLGGDENIVQIKYSIPLLNQWENIWISLDTGIVLGVKSYAGEDGDLYYECNTSVREAYDTVDARTGNNEDENAIPDSVFNIK